MNKHLSVDNNNLVTTSVYYESKTCRVKSQIPKDCFKWVESE